MSGPETWDESRNDAWDSVCDELPGMSRDTWEDLQDIKDYGPCNDELGLDD